MTNDAYDVPDKIVQALSIADLFGTAMARGSIYSAEAINMAADYMSDPRFSREEGDKELIAAIVKWLREQAAP